eukprot:m.345552 g.345552  ORF g.345552 m.345552 type:complete len:69 (+) comp55814_c2_seq8:93-299(+)
MKCRQCCPCLTAIIFQKERLQTAVFLRFGLCTMTDSSPSASTSWRQSGDCSNQSTSAMQPASNQTGGR